MRACVRRRCVRERRRAHARVPAMHPLVGLARRRCCTVAAAHQLLLYRGACSREADSPCCDTRANRPHPPTGGGGGGHVTQKK